LPYLKKLFENYLKEFRDEKDDDEFINIGYSCCPKY